MSAGIIYLIFRISIYSLYTTMFVRLLAEIAQSVQRLATGWTVQESHPVGNEIFRTRLDRRFGPSRLLKMGTRFLARG